MRALSLPNFFKQYEQDTHDTHDNQDKYKKIQIFGTTRKFKKQKILFCIYPVHPGYPVPIFSKIYFGGNGLVIANIRLNTV